MPPKSSTISLPFMTVIARESGSPPSTSRSPKSATSTVRASETVTDTVLSAVCPPYTAVTVIFCRAHSFRRDRAAADRGDALCRAAYVTESGVTSSLPSRAVHTRAKVSVSYSESCVLFSERLSTRLRAVGRDGEPAHRRNFADGGADDRAARGVCRDKPAAADRGDGQIVRPPFGGGCLRAWQHELIGLLLLQRERGRGEGDPRLFGRLLLFGRTP